MAERRKPQPDHEEQEEAVFLPDLDWQIVPFSKIAKRPLQPGQVIEGVPTLSAFDSVDKQILLTLLRTAHPDTELPMGLINFRVNDDGISQQLRPEGFNGNLVNGTATILPFDAELGIEYMAKAKKELQDRMRRGETPGIRIIYQGDLRRSLHVPVGSVLQDTVYFYDLPTADSPTLQLLYRSLGPTTQRDAASQIMRETIATSVHRAQFVATRAIREAFRASAGSPGLGKHR
jgi:hypothetical protein